MPPNGDAKGRDPSHYPSGLGFSGSRLGSAYDLKSKHIFSMKDYAVHIPSIF